MQDVLTLEKAIKWVEDYKLNKLIHAPKYKYREGQRVHLPNCEIGVIDYIRYLYFNRDLWKDIYYITVAVGNRVYVFTDIEEIVPCRT